MKGVGDLRREQVRGGKKECCISQGLTTLYHPLFSPPRRPPRETIVPAGGAVTRALT